MFTETHQDASKTSFWINRW